MEKELFNFWYDSNSWYGRIKNMEDLRSAMSFVIEPKHGQLENKDEFLDRSKQHKDFADFGLRLEHDGEKTLREYLIEKGVNLSEL